jgi:hypothetical protein
MAGEHDEAPVVPIAEARRRPSERERERSDGGPEASLTRPSGPSLSLSLSFLGPSVCVAPGRSWSAHRPALRKLASLIVPLTSDQSKALPSCSLHCRTYSASQICARPSSTASIPEARFARHVIDPSPPPQGSLHIDYPSHLPVLYLRQH